MRLECQAEPPQIVVGTLERVARMIETKNLRPNAVTTIVIDEVLSPSYLFYHFCHHSCWGDCHLLMQHASVK